MKAMTNTTSRSRPNSGTAEEKRKEARGFPLLTLHANKSGRKRIVSPKNTCRALSVVFSKTNTRITFGIEDTFSSKPFIKKH